MQQRVLQPNSALFLVFVIRMKTMQLQVERE